MSGQIVDVRAREEIDKLKARILKLESFVTLVIQYTAKGGDLESLAQRIWSKSIDAIEDHIDELFEGS